LNKYEFDELLKHVALENAGQMERKIIEDEYRAAKIVEEDDEKLLELIHESDAKYRRTQRRKHIKRILQTAAAVVLVFSVTNATSFSNLDASKEHVFKTIETDTGGKISFTTKDEDKYVSKEEPLEISIADSNGEATFREGEEEMLKGLTGYWYPEEIPEGYRLTEVTDDAFGIELFFENTEIDAYIRVSTEDSSGNSRYAADHNYYRDCVVDENKGMTIYNVEDHSTTIVWLVQEQDMAISFHISENDSLGYAIEMVESLIFVQ